MYAKITKIFFFIISYFAPISTIIHVMLVFIFFDFVSGVWASCKNKEKIESKRMRKTITKIIWYIVAIFMAHMMEVTFSLQFLHLAQIVGGFICMVEIKSVFENITKITNEPIFMKIYKLFEKKAKDNFDINNKE